MGAADVLAFVSLVDSLCIRVWVDGGWAVDACLGRQTREHGDLDIAMEAADVPPLLSTLAERGFAQREQGEPWNFVLVDGTGQEIDVHAVVFDEAANGVLTPGAVYPAGSLGEYVGVISGRRVRCISPEWLVRFHTGYAVDAGDWAYVSALCANFDIPIPDEYRSFHS